MTLAGTEWFPMTEYIPESTGSVSVDFVSSIFVLSNPAVLGIFLPYFGAICERVNLSKLRRPRLGVQKTLEHLFCDIFPRRPACAHPVGVVRVELKSLDGVRDVDMEQFAVFRIRQNKFIVGVRCRSASQRIGVVTKVRKPCPKEWRVNLKAIMSKSQEPTLRKDITVYPFCSLVLTIPGAMMHLS